MQDDSNDKLGVHENRTQSAENEGRGGEDSEEASRAGEEGEGR